MGITLESASRLNALKSKIDSAVGSTSDTLSQAVDKAIARGNIQTEETTYTPTAAGKIITPSSGKYLSKVTVDPVPTETQSVKPTASAQTVTPTAGKFLSSVAVSAVPTQTKTVTPTESAQTYYPDAGKFFSAFTVEAAAASGKKVYQGEWTDYMASTANIDVGVPIKEEDIFIAYYLGSNSSTSVVLRIGTGDAYRFYAGMDYMVGAPMIQSDYASVIYYGTVVELNSMLPIPFKWCLIQ